MVSTSSPLSNAADAILDAASSQQAAEAAADILMDQKNRKVQDGEDSDSSLSPVSSVDSEAETEKLETTPDPEDGEHADDTTNPAVDVEESKASSVAPDIEMDTATEDVPHEEIDDEELLEEDEEGEEEGGQETATRATTPNQADSCGQKSPESEMPSGVLSEESEAESERKGLKRKRKIWKQEFKSLRRRLNSSIKDIKAGIGARDGVKEEDEEDSVLDDRYGGTDREAGEEDEEEEDAVEDEEDEEDEEIAEDDEQAEELKKRTDEARKALAKIEVMFAKVRDAIYEEKVNGLQGELDALEAGTHEEFNAGIAEAEERFQAVSHTATMAYGLQKEQLEERLKQDHELVFIQYYRRKDEFRQKMIAQLTAEWFQVHRDRRLAEMCVPDYIYSVPEDKGIQMMERQAYNYELTLLAGLNNYFGFPAAPDLNGISAHDALGDLQKLRR